MILANIHMDNSVVMETAPVDRLNKLVCMLNYQIK
jgi:hypothetical protein